MPERWGREVESLECTKSSQGELTRERKIIELPSSLSKGIENRFRRSDRMYIRQREHTRDIEHTPLPQDEIERDDITLL